MNKKQVLRMITLTNNVCLQDDPCGEGVDYRNDGHHFTVKFSSRLFILDQAFCPP